MHLLSSTQYKKWKAQRNVDGLGIIYENPKSFYGKHLIKSYPGVFLCTKDKIIHWSYGPKEIPLGAFSKEHKTEIAYANIKRIRRESIGILWWLAFLFPKAVLTVDTVDGKQHQFILYDEVSQLTESLKALGLGQKFV